MSEKDTMRMRVADIFSGAGGFSEGFRQLGFDVVFGLDMWGPANETHALNHPDCHQEQVDILELRTPEDIDEVVPDTEVLIGSPPCVAFSGSHKAGKADKSLGILLIEAFLRIVAWKRNKEGSILRHWVLENVPNSSPFIKDSYSFDDLELPGGARTALQSTAREVLNAADHGAPQTRNRLFIGEYPMPRPTLAEEGWVTIAHVMEKLGDPLKRPEEEMVQDPLYPISLPLGELTDHFYDTRVEEFEWKNARRLKVDHGFMGRMSFPEDPTRPSRTIMATRSASTREALLYGAEKNENGYFSYRLPTIREISSLMSFPMTYQFEGSSEATKYRLVGNAVCPLMARAIAGAILEIEDIQGPERFVPPPGVMPSLDLTGMKRRRREPKPRRPDARFAIHIPNLKLKNTRVEMTNKLSDFENDRFVWSSLLHWGTGKNARCYEVDQGKLKQLLMTRFGEFGDFEKDIERTFKGQLPGPTLFQRLYCRLEEADKLGPMEALEEMKELVDEHFPLELYEQATTKYAGSALGVGKDELPVRILAGLYVCNHVVTAIGSSGS